MKLSFLLVLISFSLSSFSKVYSVKKNKLTVKVDFTLPKNFQIKKNFLNTPLLMWHKSLLHHGPSVGIYPLKGIQKGFASKKSVKTYFSRFKKEQEENLKSIRGRNLKFGKTEVLPGMIRFHISYTLGKGDKVYLTETHKLCLKNSLKIRTIVKRKDTKKFYPLMDKLVREISCKK